MPDSIFLITSFVIALLVTAKSVPAIVKVSKLKHLYDEPNSRKATQRIIPTLGGAAIFIALIIAVTLGSYGNSFPELRYIFCGLTILFFVGIKDDILILSARKKLLIQIITALILVFFANIRFTSVHGFMEFHHIPFTISAILTVFAVIVITNAFNLIDGIDGLASGTGILTSGALGAWFFISGNFQYALIAFSLTGALTGFFIFNVWGNKNKIFMGDTGSLLIGFIMSVLVVQFAELNITQTNKFSINSVPAVAFGILIIPLFDTIRVFSIRLIHGHSPFTPDKNHVHHRLLHLGYSHKQATARILIVNLIFIFLNIFLMNLSVILLLGINVALASILSMVPIVLMKHRKVMISEDDPHQQVFSPAKELGKMNKRIIKKVRQKKEKKKAEKEALLV